MEFPYFPANSLPILNVLALKGDEKVLIETAFRQYQNPMQKHIASFCGDETAAMDAVSQAFTQAWIRKDTLEAMPEPAMKAWLYATARNAAVDIKRKERSFSPMPEYDLPDDGEWNPTDRITVEELMRSLPSDLSIPLHLKYWQGMNSAQIGLVMGIPPATVRTRIRTALTKLRRNANDLE